MCISYGLITQQQTNTAQLRCDDTKQHATSYGERRASNGGGGGKNRVFRSSNQKSRVPRTRIRNRNPKWGPLCTKRGGELRHPLCTKFKNLCIKGLELTAGVCMDAKVVEINKVRRAPALRYKCICGCVRFEAGVTGLHCLRCEGVHPYFDVLNQIQNPEPPTRF